MDVANHGVVQAAVVLQCGRAAVSAMRRSARTSASTALAPMRSRTSAPIAAPKNIDTVAIVRRPGRGFAPPASAESAAKPVSVRVSTVVVRSGTASRRAVAFCSPMAIESATMIKCFPTGAETTATSATASARATSRFSISSVAANSLPR